MNIVVKCLCVCKYCNDEVKCFKVVRIKMFYKSNKKLYKLESDGVL